MSTGWNAAGNLSVGRSSGTPVGVGRLYELLRARGASHRGEFEAYLYDSGLSSPPWNEDWVPAGSEVVPGSKWVSRIVPGIGTQPVDAIQSGLLLQPPLMPFFS